MSMRESLVQAMHIAPDSDTVHWINESGLAVADKETMSQAIHDVYCGVMADHHAPNEKDLAQAQAMIDALRKIAMDSAPS
jgi:alpha-D-ribose 1-methylphosphonate 5-triphosphate diphosphatase PhnM